MRIVCLLSFIIALLVSPVWAAEDVDLEVVNAIKHEVEENSKVMHHLFHLVDVSGNRLTGSPGFQAAADWAVKQMDAWGLENVRQEKWGPFGQGWSVTRFSAHVIEPRYEALIGVPMGWTPGTDGVVMGAPMIAPLLRENNLRRDRLAVEDYVAKHKGKLKGQIILISPFKEIKVSDKPLYRSFTSEELSARGKAPDLKEPIDYSDPDLEIPLDPEMRRDFLARAPRWFNELMREERRKTQSRLNQFLTEEGVRLVIHTAARGDGGTVFPPRAGSRYVEDPVPPPSIALTPEQYNRLYRLTDKGVGVKIEVEVQAQFHREDLDSLNVVGEIPGGAKADELVMIGAHLDSVDTGLGATDNAAGSAVMLEVMRILKALNLKLDRTVRIALWGGEEQGLLGSKAYVKEHFGDPETMNLTARHAKLAAYFNVDNGTGKIRGVYLQGNDRVRPIFQSWLAPFADMGATTISIRDTGGTDHLSFDAIGLPGFQFIQDPVEYETRSHHSNMDVYDRILPGDLMQASAIVASFVYHAANRPEKLPRTPLPRPKPKVKPKME